MVASFVLPAVEDVETSSHYTADTTETGSFHTPLDVSSSDGEQPVDLSIQVGSYIHTAIPVY